MTPRRRLQLVSGVLALLSATASVAHARPEGAPIGRNALGRPVSPWQSRPRLEAPAGVTAVAGQVLRLNGDPLPDVTLELAGRTTRTDAAGRFLLAPVPDGHQVLLIDGQTATRPGRTYGVFKVGVDVAAGRTTVLDYTIWLPRLDTAHAVTIPSPTRTETVVTNPTIPGLELRIPPQTTIRDHRGRPVRRISLTRIPLDQPPFPLPENLVNIQLYFTAQPGGGVIEGPGLGGARIIYPNARRAPAGMRLDFWHYEPGDEGWYVYGQGTVTADGRQVIPDPGVVFYELTGAKIADPSLAPASGPAPGTDHDGEPVNLSTGLFVYRHTDLVVPDVIPLVLTRTYRPQDTRSRPFGIGTTHPYEMFVVGDLNPATFADLILPEGGRIHYRRITPGTELSNAVYEASETPTTFLRSRIVGSGLTLTRQDGTVYTFPNPEPPGTPQKAALLAIQDRYGNRVQATRHPDSGDLLRITSPNGRWIQFNYDAAHRITLAFDNLGRTVVYNYDAAGRLARVTDPNGGVTEYTYDAAHRMLTITDPRGIVYLTNTYYGPGPNEGRVQTQTQKDQTTYQFAYTLDQGRVIQTDVTDPRNVVRRVAFNPAGFTMTDIRALGLMEQQTLTYERNSPTNPDSNLVSAVTDTLMRRTTFDYDVRGNLLTLTRVAGTPDAVQSTFTYEPGVFDMPMGFNRLRSMVPSTATTDGQLTIDYIALTQATITDARAKQTVVAYNGRGQVLSISDPLQHGTTFEYDAATADLTALVDPVQDRTTRGYDAVGRMLRQTDPRSRITSFVPDALNRLTSIGDAAGGATRFGYDPNGNLLSLTDALGHATTYHPNDMDRIDLRTDPLGRSETFHYDPNGNLDLYTDRKSQQTTFTYDGLNRRRVTSYLTDGGSTTFNWDGGDRLLQAIDTAGGMITNTWTPRDRLLTQQSPQGFITYTEYDTLDRLKRMTPTGQSQIVYTYNPISQLASVQQGTQIATLGYDDAARRMTLTLPNTVPTTYGYDNANRLTSLLYGPAGSLGTLGYTYDPASNRTAVSGSFARTLLPAAVATSSYDAANRQRTFGGSTMTYDNNGNLGTITVQSAGGPQVTQFTWDQRNRLGTLAGPSLAASFGYDGLGRRTSRTVNASSLPYLYDGVDILREGSGAAGVNYLRGLAVDEPFSRGTSEQYLTDALGSTVALTNANGNLRTTYSYEPFGRTQASGPASTNPFQFTGRENDGTGLYYYRARYYHPGLARFISEDSIGFASGDVNLYGYVGNSPVNFIDPFGLDKGTSRSECGGLGSVRDYVAFQVNVGPGAGPQGQVVVDRYGQIYISIGLQIGRSPFLVSGSWVQGMLLSRNVPLGTTLTSFFSGGPAFNFGGGLGPGANIVWTGKDVALEVGAFFPQQIGGGYTYGGRVGQVRSLGWKCEEGPAH
jgi:RHS repeat-associated protein